MKAALKELLTAPQKDQTHELATIQEVSKKRKRDISGDEFGKMKLRSSSRAGSMSASSTRKCAVAAPPIMRSMGGGGLSRSGNKNATTHPWK